jgi:hypothetical protein
MKSEFAPFFHAELDGKDFYSEEDFERYQKERRRLFYTEKTCCQKMQWYTEIIVSGFVFFFLLVRAKLFDE